MHLLGYVSKKMSLSLPHRGIIMTVMQFGDYTHACALFHTLTHSHTHTHTHTHTHANTHFLSQYTQKCTHTICLTPTLACIHTYTLNTHTHTHTHTHRDTHKDTSIYLAF